MSDSILICLIVVSASLFTLGIDVGYSPEITWRSLSLGEYSGYNTINILKFMVPVSTENLILTLQGSPSDGDCPARKVFVYFQYGSFPVISPYNASFPDNFYLERSELQDVNLHTDNKSVPVTVETPKPGSWYLTAFLLKTEQYIKPKGFSKECKYKLQVQVVSTVLVNVEELNVLQGTRTSIPFPSKFKTLRYQLPEGTYSYTVNVNRCNITYNHTTSPVPSCHFTLLVSMETVPRQHSKDTFSYNCSNDSDSCQAEFTTPPVLQWNYIRFVLDKELLNFTFVEFYLTFQIKQCKVTHFNSSATEQKTKNDISETLTASGGNVNDTGSTLQFTQKTTGNQAFVTNSGPQLNKTCEVIISLGAFTYSKTDFSTIFLFPNSKGIPDPDVAIEVPDRTVLLTYFILNGQRDSGGTLTIQLLMMQGALENTQDGKVWICLMKNRIPGLSSVVKCEGGVKLAVNSMLNNTLKDTHYVPYPEEGRWYLGLHSQCFGKNNSGISEPCKHLPTIKMTVSLSKCVDNSCGSYGTCKEYISGVLIFSACDCYSGWRGYGCTDGTEAQPDSLSLTAVLLLSLSNLFFIPGILVALHRRYFMEALVYTYNMFFSTFYHACDTNKHIHRYCLMKYGVLSFCDLFGSILSFWVTILAMARINEHLRLFLHVLGAVGIAVAVEHNQHYSHDIWAFVVPTVLSVVIMLISWVLQCYKRKACFPSKWRYLKYLLPGFVLSGLGLIIFAFLETDDNYKYTHSAWHMVISLSIVFLLPPTSRKEKKSCYNLFGGRESMRMMHHAESLSDDEEEDNNDYSEPLIVHNSVRTRNIIL